MHLHGLHSGLCHLPIIEKLPHCAPYKELQELVSHQPIGWVSEISLFTFGRHRNIVQISIILGIIWRLDKVALLNQVSERGLLTQLPDIKSAGLTWIFS